MPELTPQVQCDEAVDAFSKKFLFFFRGLESERFGDERCSAPAKTCSWI